MTGHSLPRTIDGRSLRRLVETGAVEGVTVVGSRRGWAVVVDDGVLERTIAAFPSRDPRLFARLEEAADFVSGELGLQRFEVEASQGAVSRPEPSTGELGDTGAQRRHA